MVPKPHLFISLYSISLSTPLYSTSSKTMDGGSGTTGGAAASESQLLQLAQQSLRLRDLSGCRSYAMQALNRNPKLAAAERILAAADVIIAAETTAVCNPNDMKNPNPNYYTVLQIPSRTDDATLIRNQFKKLILLVNPIMHSSPPASEAFRLIDKAYVLLNDPVKRARFDSELSECYLNKHKHYHDEVGDAFWTACPYCYCVFEYARVYEDCCLRCQKCGKAFEGVAIPSPPPMLEVDGKDEYLCCLGSYPLGFIREADCRVNKGANACQGGDWDLNKLGEGEEEIKEESKPKGGRRKTVAKSVKKITGTGNKVKRVIDCDVGMTSEDGGFVMDGIQYFPGGDEDDDALFVGLIDV